MAETTLIIREDGKVDVCTQEEGVIVKKTTTFEAVADLFLNAAKEPPPPEPEKWLTSPVLPPGTVAYCASENGRIISLVMEWGPDVLPFQFEKTLFAAVPYPRLIFKMRISKGNENFRVYSVNVAAVKGKNMLEAGTPLWHYPYSHVQGTWMCVGSFAFPVVQKLTELRGLPRLILTTPNGDHHYDSDSNGSGLVLRQLLQAVDGTEAFPEDWLNPLELTLGDWLKDINF